MEPRWVVRAASALAAGLLAAGAAGCSGSENPDAGSGAGSGTPSTRSTGAVPTPSASSSSRTPSTGPRYVALGDSYSAGPLIPTTQLAGGCLRSDHNYASLVARRLHLRLVDVTCSGADTSDLTSAQQGFTGDRVAPQLRALTSDTRYVTLGIGGNDFSLFSTLTRTCPQLRAEDPSGAPCARRLAARGPDLVAATATIGTRVTTALREIRSRAPRARVVLVGYLRAVPDRGTCAALPLATGDYAEGRRITAALARAMARAARAAGVRYVDMHAVSRGHDVCASRPWVNGKVTDQTRALAYHPLEAGMRATADRVAAALRR